MTPQSVSESVEAIRRRLQQSREKLQQSFTVPHPRKVEILRSRAAELAGRGRTSAKTTAYESVLVVTLGDDRYGISLANVIQVAPAKGIVPVPGASAPLLGVVALGGEIRSVIDLRQLLFEQATKPTDATPHLVTIRLGKHEVVLCVDRTEEMRQVAVDEIRPPLADSASDTLKYLRGITPDNLMLLRLTAIVHACTKTNASASEESEPSV